MELTGNHAGMLQHLAQFAAQLRSLLQQPVPDGPGNTETCPEVTK